MGKGSIYTFDRMPPRSNLVSNGIQKHAMHLQPRYSVQSSDIGDTVIICVETPD